MADKTRIARSGAVVKFCGHDGTFIADIFEVGTAVVIYANGDIMENLVRPARDPTHHVVDFPEAGMWKPRRGVLVVPRAQCKVLR